jgi:dTDP-glucose 4,6-dehydratase
LPDFSTILVTGGCGFIGSNFIRYLFTDQSGFTGKVINLDKLTYAGNPLNLTDIDKQYGERYQFIRGDICDPELVDTVFTEHDIDTVVHFAAESHVDRSIYGPKEFINTNILTSRKRLPTIPTVPIRLQRRRPTIWFFPITTPTVYR